MRDYAEYLKIKSQMCGNDGFKPTYIPEKSFDFQESLIDWGVRKGRGAIFADCGLGKSLIELAFAENIVRKTNGKVLLLTPIAVGTQMEKEGRKFGIECHRSRDGQIHGKITITNYEQLHYFDPADFTGIICDESSILKNFNGKTKQAITIFGRKIRYRLLATATAAPNDFIELGTSSEALGYLGYMDMLNKFFKNDQNNCATNRAGRFQEATKWRLKGHAHDAFWRWVASWSRSCRKPSDLGFDDGKFKLTKLIENKHEIRDFDRTDQGFLFSIPAHGLNEQRDERRATIEIRCEKAAEIANKSDDFCVIWCNLNSEGDLLEKIVKDSVQVSGRDSDDAKEEKLTSFTEGKTRVLIIKPKIGAFGLNWQHCNHTIFFPTHSYEQKYQAVRRFWRFGQKRPVTVDNIFTDGDALVIENLDRKSEQAVKMFDCLVKNMRNGLSIQINEKDSIKTKLPIWMK